MTTPHGDDDKRDDIPETDDPVARKIAGHGDGDSDTSIDNEQSATTSDSGVSGTSMGARPAAESIEGSSEGFDVPAGESGGGIGAALSGFGARASSIIFGLAQLVVNGGKSAARSAGGMFKSIGRGFLIAGGRLSSFTGGAISPVAGTAITGGGALIALLTSGAMALALFGIPQAAREGRIDRCSDHPMTNQAAESNSGVASGDIRGEMEDQGRLMWSALSKAGMSDENIAGMLGNFQVESKLDPTAVEGIFDEPYEVGPKKKAAEKRDFANNGNGNSATRQLGIGVGQWTNERNIALRKYADSKGAKWHDLDLQMSFLLDKDSGDGNYDTIKPMLSNSNEGSDDPADASYYFLIHYERPQDQSRNGPNAQLRAKNAESWYVKMGSWTKDSSFANSVLTMAQTTSRSADNKAAQQEMADCPGLAGGSSAGGNEDAAKAMATYSWEDSVKSVGNKGTELYQYLMGEIFPGDPYFMSCDRGVATAVRWSGTDDTIPAGPTSVQYQYFTGEGGDKWEQIPDSDISDESKMKAGDVLITKGDGHIQMYLSKEVIEDVWGSTPHLKDASMAAASYMERSPGLQHWNDYIGDRRPYSGWRSKGPEKNPKYKDIKIPPNIKDGPSTASSGMAG